MPAGLSDPCWYRFTADWWLTPPASAAGVPFCTVLHLGLLFDVDAANVIIDLRGWWTRDGIPMGELHQLPNQGFVPLLGFDVWDSVEVGKVIRIADGNVIQPPPSWPPIPVEIVQMDVVAFPASAPPQFVDLRTGGGQETYPWVPVLNSNGAPIGPSNPMFMPPDSFFDVWLEIDLPDQPRPAQPVVIPPGGFLVSRQRLTFLNNAGQRETRWTWEIHGDQPSEACCLQDGSCQDLPPAECFRQGGIPQGMNTTCANTVCEAPPEACCLPNGRCHLELPEICRQQGGIPQGPGSVCLGDANSNGVDDVCEELPLKWIQPPDTNKTGIDVRATKPVVLADDFQCTEQTAITEITVWGSWRGEVEPDYERAGNVVFTLSIHADIPDPNPDEPDDYSMPGEVLWLHRFSPGDFAYGVEQQNLIEWWMDPLLNEAWTPGDHVCWRYVFRIPATEAFCQMGKPDAPVVYWLDVQAETQGAAAGEFGWKTSMRHWNDDAVWGQGDDPFTGPWKELRYPPNHIWQGESIDLAFAISGDEPCEPKGACCYELPGSGILCMVTDQLTCEAQLAGQWKGVGTDCTDADGNQVADICEEPPREMDFGDAPEGALAYPNGVMGSFPTCMNVGPAKWIQHTNFGAWFGPRVDLEMDGNGGLCPAFAPYDNDECMNDGDAGLLIPGAYTLHSGGVVTPCPQSPGGPLGATCTQATWGRDIDIHLQNMMPNQTPGFVNVLIDWNQDGKWAGASMCPVAGTPEHVLVNWMVPAGFAGPLSALAPPGFLIGPQTGYVWVRFSLTERPVGVGWDGSGMFEDGETEDYLLEVVEFDWGDAPDRPYPTLAASMGAHHVIVPGMFLGNRIDAEPDGQPNPGATGDDLANVPDEDGVVFLTPLVRGRPAVVQVTASIPGRLDAWLDFNQNGSWADLPDQIFGGVPLAPGPNLLTFLVPTSSKIGPTYARFRYSRAGGLSFTGPARDGEVEDYQVKIVPAHFAARHVFYNGSGFDGARTTIDPGPTPGPRNDDGDAVDTSKQPLMVGGGFNTFANVSGFTDGLTGLVYDVQDTSRDPVLSDFTFTSIGRLGDGVPTIAVTPVAIGIWHGLGVGGSDRVFITFAPNTVPARTTLQQLATWVRVDVGTGFGLPASETHWWGFAPGDTGPTAGVNMLVNATDVSNIGANPTTPSNRSPVTDPNDVNKSSLCNATDASWVGANNTTPSTCLRQIAR